MMYCRVGTIFIVIICLNCVKKSESLFFQALGLGASNCQCQSSCSSPPPPLGCFCPPPPVQPLAAQPQGCSASPLLPQPAYPSYQPPQPPPPPQQPFPPNNNFYPPMQNQGGYAQTSLQLPPPPIPLQPPPIQVAPAYGTGAQPPPGSPGGYGADNAQAPAYPTFNNQQQSLQQIKLQPPSRSLGNEYMRQLMKVFEPPPMETTTAQTLVRNELPSSYYAGNPNPNRSMNRNMNTNTITETEQEPEMMEQEEDGFSEEGNDEEELEVGNEEENVENDRVTVDLVEEMQPYSNVKTSNYGSRGGYIPKSQFNSGKELRTTEIKISQAPYEESVPLAQTPHTSYKTTHSGSYGDNGVTSNVLEEKVEGTWTSSTDKYYTTTPTSKGISRKYSIDQTRGEGFSGPTTPPDIAESGYEFTGPSSPLPPITLDYLNVERQNYANGHINPQREIEAFTMDVDKYHRNSGSTIPIPSSSVRPTPPTPPTDFGYGAARDPRHSNEESKNNEMSSQNHKTDENPKIIPLLSSKIQGKTDNSSNTSENQSDGNNEDFYDEMTTVTLPDADGTLDISKKKDEKISKCNSASLKEMMHKKMTLSPSISKQMIYSAASEMFPGRNVNVVCSKHSFSYIVVTSPVFCEHRKRPLTCFAFFQP